MTANTILDFIQSVVKINQGSFHIPEEIEIPVTIMIRVYTKVNKMYENLESDFKLGYISYHTHLKEKYFLDCVDYTVVEYLNRVYGKNYKGD